MLFQNILVPWDGSKYSNHAFKIALDVAKKYDSKINVVSCLSHADTGASYLNNGINKEIFKTAKNIIGDKMSELKDDAKKAGISTSIDVFITDSTVKQLVTYAKANKVDLVVMGSHGLTGWKKVLLGSVANGVSQQVHCPVLIVR
ncbi:universal stress protein [Nitrosopumilus sp. b3]|uniref:universal stress protein n=1 Tax=Nitrosopumilus sp. b3 TaxID=2109909 RepID=UPI0015F3DD63|nr:universal stress protein [Nitrosopumilus sp. b3]KAF6246251.1 universal stress protein [Nitrosopumilus sp. b3]